jgi:hypothetical protein
MSAVPPQHSTRTPPTAAPMIFLSRLVSLPIEPRRAADAPGMPPGVWFVTAISVDLANTVCNQPVGSPQTTRISVGIHSGHTY